MNRLIKLVVISICVHLIAPAAHAGKSGKAISSENANWNWRHMSSNAEPSARSNGKRHPKPSNRPRMTPTAKGWVRVK